jgi:hypothetical protein
MGFRQVLSWHLEFGFIWQTRRKSERSRSSSETFRDGFLEVGSRSGMSFEGPQKAGEEV